MQDTNFTSVLDFIRSDEFTTAYEQFKKSKQLKKEWEVVAFYFKPQLASTTKRIIVDCNSHQWNNAKADDGETFGIYSIRRLIDSTTWAIDEKVEVFEMGYVIIKGFEIRDTQVYVITDGGTYLLSDLKKKPTETWLTEDGVEVLVVENGLIWYADSNKFDGAHWLKFSDKVNTNVIKEKFPHFKYFSTRQAAEQWLENNRPCLSIEDVRKACEGLYTSSLEIVMRKAAELVKSKTTK
jgi:hypothetical protein